MTMQPKTDRRSQQGAESRARILAATLELASELGYDGTSISKVSQRSGLPASSVYWHFSSKDQLFAEVIQFSFDQWRAALPLVESVGHARVAERVRLAVDGIAQKPEFWRLGLMLTLEDQPVELLARRRFVEIRREVLDHLSALLTSEAQGEQAGFAKSRADDLARLIMAATDGLFISARAEGVDGISDVAGMLGAWVEAAAVGRL
ncbi:MAG: TetR/AcrR family transcriptional regulator [Ilumatobacteraceae bacterium]